MIEQFRALPMTWEGARAAYPLVYLHDASISLDDWLRFARRRDRAAARQGGLMTIRDCRDIIHALFSYRVDIDLRIRRRLCIGDMIVAHLPGGLIDEAIVTSARQIATRFGCHTIFVEQPLCAGADMRPGCPTAHALTAAARPVADMRQH